MTVCDSCCILVVEQRERDNAELPSSFRLRAGLGRFPVLWTQPPRTEDHTTEPESTDDMSDPICNKHKEAVMHFYEPCSLCEALGEIKTLRGERDELRGLLGNKDALIADLLDSLSRANEEANRHARKLLELDR